MTATFITCKNLSSVKHAFFTRNGGVSDGIYGSLNCGEGSSDVPGNAKANRKLAMQALGFANADNLYSLNQIHSVDAVILNEVPQTRLPADGMVTNKPGIALGILTADCTPILFSDKNATGFIF